MFGRRRGEAPAKPLVRDSESRLRNYLIEALERRRLLAAASFAAPVYTPLPGGFQFAGMIDSGYAPDFIAKSASGGGLIVQWQNNGAFSVLAQINTTAQILWFTDDTQLEIPLQVYTTKGIMTQQRGGTFSPPSGFTFPADAVSDTWGIAHNGVVVERYTPDPADPGRGTLRLADFPFDLSTQTLTPEVDTVIGVDVPPPAFGSPIFSMDFTGDGSEDDNSDQADDLIVNDRVWLSNGDGTFSPATNGPIGLAGFNARTRFYPSYLDGSSGSSLLAFPVNDGSSPSDAVALLSDPTDSGAFNIVRTIPLGAAGSTSGVLVRGSWTGTYAQDWATALLSGPGSPAVEVLPGRGDGTFFALQQVAEPVLVPFSQFSRSDNCQAALLCTQTTAQGTSLVSLFNTAPLAPVASLTASANPSVAGEPITLSAIVPNWAGNSVTFYDGTTKLADAIVQNDDTAVLLISSLAAGSHQITVVAPNYHVPFERTVLTQVVDPPPQNSPYVELAGFSVKPSVTLSGSIPPGSNVNISFTLKNVGGTAAGGDVHFQISAIPQNTLDDNPIPLSVPSLTTASLRLAAGQSMTLTAVWVPPQSMPQQYYSLLAQITGDAALHLSPALSGPVTIAPSIKIVWAFGGDTPASSVPFVLDFGNGHVVTFSLTDGGTGVVTENDPSLTFGGGSPDLDVVLYETTANSNLTVTQTGVATSNIVSLTGGPLATADLRQDTPHSVQLGSTDKLIIGPIPLAAPRTASAGTTPTQAGSVTVQGTLMSFIVQVLNAGVSITTGYLSPATAVPMTVSIGTIESGGSLQTDQPISTLEVGFAAAGSSIQAYSIGQLISADEFDANLTLAQPPTPPTAQVPALGNVTIGGSVTGTAATPVQWHIGGSVGKVRIAGNVAYLQLTDGDLDASGVGSLWPATMLLFSVGGYVHSSVIGNQTPVRGSEIRQIIVGGGIDLSTRFVASKVPRLTVPPPPPPLGAHLVWVSQPRDIVAGHRLNAIVVEWKDSTGNLITTEHSIVTLSISSGPDTGNNIATARFKGGVASFERTSFNTKTAGSYSFEADDDNLAPLVSNEFTVAPGRPFKMHLLDLGPTPGLDQSYFGDVQLLDRYGNLVTSDTSEVGFESIPPSNPFDIGVAGPAGVGVAAFANGVASFRLVMSLGGIGHGWLVDFNPHVQRLRLPPINTFN